MLRYNFERILKAKGIERPYTYLMKNGFTDRIATRVNQNNVKRVDLSTVERLCLLFKCTPNDLMEWIPETTYQEDSSQPLNGLRRTDQVIDIIKALNDAPLDKLSDIEAFISETIKKK
ncbi:MAG: helix-turn-helix transcriptional regulator [Marinilabiliaceae bacterium]|nr:helix-turn-helix transcriptional regulator [Marinilabiliaceae bacterium]